MTTSWYGAVLNRHAYSALSQAELVALMQDMIRSLYHLCVHTSPTNAARIKSTQKGVDAAISLRAW